MLKLLNFVYRFIGKKIIEFCEASKSYTSALYDNIVNACKMSLWVNLYDTT